MLYNSTNIHVTVNGRWLHDAASISYQQQGGVDPLYGYMDREFRAVSRRQNIIAGTIGIYFKEHDRFFRYLAGVGDSAARQGIRSEQDLIRAEVQHAVDTGNLSALLQTLDLTNPDANKYLAELQRIQKVKKPNVDWFEQYKILNSDVLGDAGHALNLARPGGGATIDIHYGDKSIVEDSGIPNFFDDVDYKNLNSDRKGAPHQIESLKNVWIVGRAKSPIENSPRVGADPVMEYYSFIASKVGRQ